MKEYDIYDEYEELDDIDEYEDKSLLIRILSFFSTWFIRIGVVISIIVFIYYIVTGEVTSAFLFVLGLVVAFFFGYAFMFLLDKLISSN